MEIAIFRRIYLLIACHLIGDYVLQSDFLAKTKGTNWYHLLIHCFLYTVPFYFCFGFDLRLFWIFVIHIITDALKAKYHKLNYVQDQILHYMVLIYYLF